MPHHPPIPFFLRIICALLLLAQYGCSVTPPKIQMVENPDGTVNIHTRDVTLRSFIEEWSIWTGVEFEEISNETEDHHLFADMYEVYLQEALEVILLDKGFVYHDREASVKILSLEEYQALPPVKIEYPILSKEVEYALQTISNLLKKMNIPSESDPENAVIAVTATWEEHDRVQDIILQFGSIEPSPPVPEMVWPENLPEQFISKPSQNNDSLIQHVHISHAVEIRYASASRLAEKLQELMPLYPDERLTVIPMANLIILRATEKRIQEISAAAAYLDDTVWYSKE